MHAHHGAPNTACSILNSVKRHPLLVRGGPHSVQAKVKPAPDWHSWILLHTLQLWLRDGSGGWRHNSTGVLRVRSEGLAARYQQLYQARRYTKLHDFDEHLNDISK